MCSVEMTDKFIGTKCVWHMNSQYGTSIVFTVLVLLGKLLLLLENFLAV